MGIQTGSPFDNPLFLTGDVYLKCLELLCLRFLLTQFIFSTIPLLTRFS